MSIGILQSTLLALGIFASSLTPKAAPATTDLPIPEVIQEISYVVKTGDTLSSISEELYGYQDYWTTILNDNDWIKDPDLLEPGWEIKLQTTPPLLVESTDLQADEVERFNTTKSTPTPLPTIIVQAQSTINPTTQPTQPITPAASTTVGPLSDSQIQFLGNCESGMTAARNSGNGYYGAFQFSPATWRSMGTGYERADMAPLDVQRDAVQRLLQRSSIFTQFPGCARKMLAAGVL